MSNKIPICPLLSAGNESNLVCTQENCAWYINSYKLCSVYLLAHNAVLDIKEKQNNKSAQ